MDYAKLEAQQTQPFFPMFGMLTYAQILFNALGQTNFVLVHGGPFVTLTIEFNELRFFLGLALSVRNGLKICANKHV